MLSWKIPAMRNAARALASSIRPITTSRFSASSEAVGSSSSRIGCPPMKPRARLTRCCSPPEKVAGGRPCSRRGMLSRSSSASASARPSPVRLRLRGFGHDLQRRDSRHHAQELAHIAQRLPPDLEHDPRIGWPRSRPRSPRCQDADRCRHRLGSCRRAPASASISPRRRGRSAPTHWPGCEGDVGGSSSTGMRTPPCR